MGKNVHHHLAAIALLTLAAQTAHANTFQEVTSNGCFLDKQNLTGAPLSASAHCGGGTAAAQADIGLGGLGAMVSSDGTESPLAHAQFVTNLFFLPNQVVPLTVTMHFTGAITGDPAIGDLFQAAVELHGLNFGVAG